MSNIENIFSLKLKTRLLKRYISSFLLVSMLQFYVTTLRILLAAKVNSIRLLKITCLYLTSNITKRLLYINTNFHVFHFSFLFAEQLF